MTTTPVLAAIDETSATSQGRPPLDVIYEWLTTVDHKKIGLMYITYALVFLVIGGIEAMPDAHSAWRFPTITSSRRRSSTSSLPCTARR